MPGLIEDFTGTIKDCLLERVERYRNRNLVTTQTVTKFYIPWEEDLHPRGPDGKWINKGGPASQAGKFNAIKRSQAALTTHFGVHGTDATTQSALLSGVRKHIRAGFHPDEVVAVAKHLAEGKAIPGYQGKKETAPPTPKARTYTGNARPGMRPITDADRARFKPPIPPAWSDVHVAEDENAPLQVIGSDSKGRAQYRYSASHTEKQAAAKFQRAKEFNSEMPKLQKQFERDSKDASHPQHTEAVVLNLIHKTGFRVGGETDTGAKEQAYGATTLQSQHVKVDGDKVSFTFTGKKGVKITKDITDPDIAKWITERQSKIGPNDKLFDTNDQKVRDYLHDIDGPYKVKDFRTWHGTGMALHEMEGRTPPTNQKEFDKARLEIGKIVSLHLGNTPKVALESYIDPMVFDSWQTGLKG